MTDHDMPSVSAGDAAGEAAMKVCAEMLAERFGPLAAALAANENQIVTELVECQGVPVDLDGYYLPDPALAEAAMRPSTTFNDILDGFRAGG